MIHLATVLAPVVSDPDEDPGPNPFASIESATEYLRLLHEALQEAQLSFHRGRGALRQRMRERRARRRREAMQLVGYKLSQLTITSRQSLCPKRSPHAARLLLHERGIGIKP